MLASGSPRRRKLITALDVDTLVVGSSGDEDAPHSGESVESYVQRLALVKARDACRTEPLCADTIVLGADTSVALGCEIIGKPADEADAYHTLRALRGRMHRVVTGIAAVDAASGAHATTAKVSNVHMRHYSDAEIAAYVASGEAWDKAGSYAAQDETFKPAYRIEGCYSNVVGLPLCDVLTLLNRMGMRVWFRPAWQQPNGCTDCAQWAAVSPHADHAPNQTAISNG